MTATVFIATGKVEHEPAVTLGVTSSLDDAKLLCDINPKHNGLGFPFDYHHIEEWVVDDPNPPTREWQRNRGEQWVPAGVGTEYV